MSGKTKVLVVGLGMLAALLILLQLALGLTILNAIGNPSLQHAMNRLLAAHRHNGFVSVGVSLLYIVVSLAILARLPTRREP